MHHTRRRNLRFVVDPVDPDPNPTTGGVVFTDEQQARINQIAAEQKARGERAAKEAADAALKAKLGDLSLDDLLATHQAAKDAEDKTKSDAQRALEAANAAKAEADKLKADAVAELHSTRVTAALIAAGAPEAAVAAIKVDVAVDATPDDIKAAVAALKTRVPGLFTTATGTTADPGKPGGTPPVSGVGAAGKAEFERRFPKAS
jgi:hypothetical protein